MLAACVISITSTSSCRDTFPSIPLLAVGAVQVVATGLSATAFVAMYLAWLICYFGPPVKLSRYAATTFLLAGLTFTGLAFAADQHWLQPWMWQAFLIFVVDAWLPSDVSKRRWWMRLACSIYIFSAISKFDVAFIDNLGRLIVVDGLAPALGLDSAFWSIELKRIMAASMPVLELSAGIALWTVRWRRFGLWLATAMHAGLLTALGPLGLDHHAGVLLWNVFFVIHIWVLFHRSGLALNPNLRQGRGEANPDTTSDSTESNPRRFAAREAVLTLLLLLPIGEPIGLYDHWPGWSVYSNRPPIIRLEVAFPEPVEGVDWVGTPEPLTNLQIVSLSGWSYATWRTPPYPQERFQLAVIDALLDKLPAETRFRVRVKTFSPRRTGQWSETAYESRAALADRLDDFWLPTAASNWSLPGAIEASLASAEDAPASPTTGESILPN